MDGITIDATAPSIRAQNRRPIAGGVRIITTRTITTTDRRRDGSAHRERTGRHISRHITSTSPLCKRFLVRPAVPKGAIVPR